MLVYCWHRLHGHRVRDHVLHDVAGRREQGGDHEPGLDIHDLGHHLGVGDDRVHDPDTERDQTRAYIDQNRFLAPDQVDQVTERHFQRPGDTRPERQTSKEGGGKIEILFDEKGPDDGGQSGHARRKIHHQRGQVSPAELSPEIEERIVDPAPNGIIYQ